MQGVPAKIGTERRKGYFDSVFIQVKVAEPNVWRYKHHITWENANGPIPEGFLVDFVDGDSENCDIENLYVRPAHCRPYEVGAERIDTQKNVIRVKVAKPDTWRHKHHLVWESVNGQIPNGFVVDFKDGNFQNCDIKNLFIRCRNDPRIHPVGAERLNKQRGFIQVKVAQPNVWKDKHLVIWEKAHGARPKGYFIMFIDGDKSNCCLENLKAVPIGRHTGHDKPIGAEIKGKAGIRVKTAQPDVWKLKHRVIWEAAHGPIPKGRELEFIDGNRFNCSLDNLRIKPHAPIGTESIKEGKIRVKVGEKAWRYKHHLVWEEAHGPMPEGHVICFADNNGLNCELSNLLLLSKEELGQRVGNGWLFDDPALNKVVYGTLKLDSGIKKRTRKKKEEDVK